LAGAYYGALKVSVWFCPLVGVLLAIVGLAIQHDANHGAFSPNKTINLIFGCCNDIIGGSGYVWRYQHTVGHHVHCNDLEGDADTSTVIPLFRFNPSLPHYWHMRFQCVYMYVLYSLIGATSPFVDMSDWLNRAHGEIKWNKPTLLDAVIFWSFKAFYFFYMFYVPYVVYGNWTFLYKFYLPSMLPGGVYLATLFAVSHNNEDCEYNVRDTDDWAAQQVRTSANWASDSWLWNYIAGGLNCQVEHHLFPGIAHRHYPNLVPIVRQCTKDFGLPYYEHPSFFGILRSHFWRMYELGLPPSEHVEKDQKTSSPKASSRNEKKTSGKRSVSKSPARKTKAA